MSTKIKEKCKNYAFYAQYFGQRIKNMLVINFFSLCHIVIVVPEDS